MNEKESKLTGFVQMTKEMKKKYNAKKKQQRIDNHHFMKKIDLKFKAAVGVGLS